MPKFLMLLAAIAVSLVLATVAHAEPVNVNTASAEMIAENLNGVGITKARAIVAYRNANGPFKSVDDLTQVTGIGERTIEANKHNILLAEGEGADGDQ